MLGAILGDIAGSAVEHSELKVEPKKLWTDEDFFTDDTVLTCATASALLSYDKGDYSGLQLSYLRLIKDAVFEYPNAGWGSRFFEWVFRLPSLPALMSMSTKSLANIKFSDSYGNGCAMKIAPVAYFAKSLDEVKSLSKVLTQVTHNSAQGIYYAEAVATSIFIALHISDKAKVKDNIVKYCPEVADIKDYKSLQEEYAYSELAKDTVPAAMYCFLASSSFEDAIAKAVGLGGDADTLAAITGSIAEAFYKYRSRQDFLMYWKKAVRYLETAEDFDSMLVKQAGTFIQSFVMGKLIRR